MIELYYWPTPNGHKITIFLEEAAVPYQIHPVDIGKGEQFKADFLKISPNNRMPAIVDTDAGGGPLPIFESGAILQYLGEKTGKFLPKDTRAKYNVLQWLYWQVAGLGPMLGQASHFIAYAPQLAPKADHSYARERYVGEAKRLLRVMDTALGKTGYLAGDYSIADIASWPWVRSFNLYDFDLSEWPALEAWFDRVGKRPAVGKAIAIGDSIRKRTTVLSDEQKRHMFGKS